MTGASFGIGDAVANRWLVKVLNLVNELSIVNSRRDGTEPNNVNVERTRVQNRVELKNWLKYRVFSLVLRRASCSPQ